MRLPRLHGEWKEDFTEIQCAVSGYATSACPEQRLILGDEKLVATSASNFSYVFFLTVQSRECNHRVSVNRSLSLRKCR